MLPWESWRNAEYVDRLYYVAYIDELTNKIYWFDFDSIKNKLTNEWLWHKILDISTETFNLTSEEILFFISFFITSCASIFLVKRYGYLSVVFLVNPVFIDFMYSQLRLAFATAVLFTSYYFFKKNKFIALILLLTTPFIHTSSVIFISIFIISLVFENLEKIRSLYKTILSVLIGAFFGVITGPLMSTILTAIGDRRAEYQDMTSSISYMSFWLVIFLYLCIKGIFEKQKRNMSFYLSLITLALVSVQTILGGYPVRYIAAFFPFLIAGLIETKAKEQPIIILVYFLYTLLLWILWTNN